MSLAWGAHNEAACDYPRKEGKWPDRVITKVLYSASKYIQGALFPLPDNYPLPTTQVMVQKSLVMAYIAMDCILKPCCTLSESPMHNCPDFFANAYDFNNAKLSKRFSMLLDRFTES